jgi:uncharacterized repeat protein (TIGR03843 family)
MARELEFAEVEEVLLAAEFLDVRPLWYSSNYVYLCQMCGAGGEEFAAVYKPLKGENPLWDFPHGALYKREVGAYRLSQLLGWGMVPPTVARGGPHGVGSVQLYVEHDSESHFFVQREAPELREQLQRMCLFDVVANNADRKGGHCLLDADGKIWGIDHGLCFHAQYKLRSVIWDWVGEPIPDAWLADLLEAGTLIAADDAKATAFRAMLAPGEEDALLGRIEGLMDTKTFPAPGPNRHYPWPMV